MSDPYDLRRFVETQATTYEGALAELRSGRKASHWMWYIFPQIAGLGMSAMSQHYSISLPGRGARLSRPAGARPAPDRMHSGRERGRGPLGL